MADKQTTAVTVLVAEDNELLRLNACEMLKEQGYTVVEADSAAEALKMLESHPEIGLLFTDIEMPPEIDGLDLAHQVHARWPGVLLVITSGRLHPTDEQIADHGKFLQKPYRAKDLLEQVDLLIDEKDKKDVPPT